MLVLSLLWGCSQGGIAKYAINLQRMNSLYEVEVHIKTACILGRAWQSDTRGLKDINATMITISNRLDLSWINRVSALIDALRPALVLVHGFNGPILAYICRKRTHWTFPFVCTYHGPYSAPKLSRRPCVPVFNGLAESLYRNHATGILSVCEYSRKYLLSRGVPPDKVTVIHNGISTEAPLGDRDNLRRQLGFSEGDFIIGTASRLDPFKGLKYLIEAFKINHREVNHTKLVILGDGSNKERLMYQCRTLGITTAVCFAGYQEDVPRWLNAFDLFVLPSLAECHSIGLLEAMRAGLPIVATNVGGNPESIEDGISGLLVPPKNVTCLADKIAACIRDQSLCRRLGSAAYDRFRSEFTLERQVSHTADWLLSCTN